ncbi:MAG: hypothetical protein ACRDJ4_11240, partial [Actinomycetota bacterium]
MREVLLRPWRLVHLVPRRREAAVGVLSQLEARFEEGIGSSKFYAAWEELQRKRPLLDRFLVPEELRDFCRDPAVGYGRQDPLVLALCLAAKAEADDNRKHRIATDLLVWIFLPAL